MKWKKNNQSFYRYKVTYRVRKRDKSEEIRNDSWDTEITSNGLHFWNKKRLIRKNQEKLVSKLLKDYEVTMAEFLEEEFVLVSKYSCKV